MGVRHEFFSRFLPLRGASAEAAGSLSGAIGFAAIGIGGIGCVQAGAWPDRLGRERITIWAMAVSGVCALLMGWLRHTPVSLAATLALIWGFAVVADSAQFSAIVTEVAPAHAVGTALTLQTAVGFLLTTVTLTAVPYLREMVGWPLAFGVLALGPAAGIMAMHRLGTLRVASSSAARKTCSLPNS